MESFRAEVLLGQIVRLRNRAENLAHEVLELCCSEWFQNFQCYFNNSICVLELCCSEWFQNFITFRFHTYWVLELCCSEWFQNFEQTHELLVDSFRAVLF